jgi:membrane-bound ClpP family serine protease
VKRLFFWALLASLAAALAVPALASASAAHPRVLAIHFELEVNPVTSSYLDHELDRAQKDGYDAAVIGRHAGRPFESMRIVKTESPQW